MEAHLLDCGSLEVERKILEPRIVAPKALHQEACREREREREREKERERQRERERERKREREGERKSILIRKDRKR